MHTSTQSISSANLTEVAYRLQVRMTHIAGDGCPLSARQRPQLPCQLGVADMPAHVLESVLDVKAHGQDAIGVLRMWTAGVQIVRREAVE